MDFSHETPPKPNADLSPDEGRSHFLETLGAGDDALNSLRQLREMTEHGSDDVALSSQPDDISSVGGKVDPVRSIQIQSAICRVQADSTGNRAETEGPQQKADSQSKEKPKAKEFDLKVSVKTHEKKEESAKNVLADLPSLSHVTEEKEVVVAEAPTALVPADSAPNEQVTLACPKCAGELTLMRQHLGVEGNCVWCQLPIVAAASGANGQVRIFPPQSEVAVLEVPEVDSPTEEKVDAEISAPERPETEPASFDGEKATVEETPESDIELMSEEVKIDAEIPEEIESAGSVVDLDDEPDKDEIEEVLVTESEKTESEEAPVTLDSFQSTEQISPIDSLAPPEALPDFGVPATGFQESFKASPVVKESDEVMPDGFASPMFAPTPSPDSRDEKNSAPAELGPATEILTGLAALPVPMTEAAAVPDGFTSLPAPVEAEEKPFQEEPAAIPEEAATPEPSVKDEAIAAGFSTPTPWGAPAEAVIETPLNESDSEDIPSDFSPPAEAPTAASAPVASEPWAALPPMPSNEASATSPLDEANEVSVSAPSELVEPQSAPMSNVAPAALSPSIQTDEDQGFSGFDVPNDVRAGGGFGKLELSEPDSARELPAPQLDAKPDVEDS